MTIMIYNTNMLFLVSDNGTSQMFPILLCCTADKYSICKNQRICSIKKMQQKLELRLIVESNLEK